jgi:hypothetical protein
MDGLDPRELDEFSKQLLDIATKTMPKESAKFLRTEGNKLRKGTKSKAKKKVKADTGNYHKSIKRGKTYKYEGDTLSVRVYSNDPKSHLIEYGHRIVGKDGSEHGFKQGERVFEEASKQFINEFVQDCEQFIDEMLDKGLR